MDPEAPRLDAADPVSPAASATALPPSILDPVIADAAHIAGVAIDRVTIVSGKPVTFPDRGLGCPQTGMVYPQVQVDGYRIVVQVGHQVFDYRGSGSSFRRCDPKSR